MENFFGSLIFFIPAILNGMIFYCVPLILVIIDSSGNMKRLISVKVIPQIAKFEELLISVLAILIAAFLYDYSNYEFKGITIINNFIGKYEGIILLIVVLLSVVLMNILSHKFEHDFESDKKSSLRLLGSIFALCNLIVIRIITNNSSYDSVLICYICIILGRFISFDINLKAFLETLKGIGKDFVMFPIMSIYIFGIMLISNYNGVDIFAENLILQFIRAYAGTLMGLHVARKINREMGILK
ncbi:MAG: hypothetical protein H6Q60_1 [Oscillospiraceae bacterium]|nr:hypothetical protein [Oscillospiraceae bacterium]